MKRTRAYLPIVSCVCMFFAELNAQTVDTNNESIDEKRSIELFKMDLSERYNKVGFDVFGIVTDSMNKPLNDVQMLVDFTQTVFNFPASDNTEWKTESMTIDSEFRIQKAHSSNLIITFSKKGYYSEKYMFDIPYLSKNKEDLFLRKELHVKMIKQGTIADLIEASGDLKYDFEKGVKTCCDLSAIEKGIIKTRTINSQSTPSKYLELDFMRDKDGNIVYDNPVSFYRSSPCPSKFYIRLCSEDPDDGLILLKESNSITSNEAYTKNCMLAPENGYKTKEIEICLGNVRADGNYDSINTLLYVKCGNHFGKVIFSPLIIYNNPLKKEIYNIRIEFTLGINKKTGDRNLASD